MRARAGAEYPEEEHAAAGNAEELSPDEVAELEKELGVEQDSVPEPENPAEPESLAEPENPAD